MISSQRVMSMMEAIRFVLSYILRRKILPKTANVGKNVWYAYSASQDMYANGKLVTIGNDVTITGGVRILTHDASSFRRHGIIWVAPVKIGDRAFIGAEAIIMPGVTIGEDAVIGSGSVVTNDVPKGTVVAGAPARQIGMTDEIDAERLELMKKIKVFDFSLYGGQNIDAEKAAELVKAGEEGGFFFKDYSRK